MNTMRCRVCGSGVAESFGQLPDSGVFAGQLVSPSIEGGRLWRCKNCDSMFRFPTLTQSEYLALYEQASSSVWDGGETRRKDFATIYEYLQSDGGGSILDVGCYAGTFLEGLPGRFAKFGLEPSTSASISATSKGINILGKTLADLDGGQRFDVVVCIDVIEHMIDIETFLSDSLNHVKDHGFLIISTGNPDCFFWKRIFKAKFWYSSYPEHLVFPSYKYFCEFSMRHNLPPPEQIRFKYINFNFRSILFGMFNQFTFALSPALHRLWMGFCQSVKGNAAPIPRDIPVGAAGVFTDHQVIIFRQQKMQYA